jgi:hypothetical protein
MSINAINHNEDQSSQKLTVKRLLPLKLTRSMSMNELKVRSVETPIAATKALIGALSALKK